MAARKQYPLRIDPVVWEAVERWAKDVKQIYPIASRCGVFAKSDVQPLLNEGAAPADIAASIFQAVANQTVSGLSSSR